MEGKVPQYTQFELIKIPPTLKFKSLIIIKLFEWKTFWFSNNNENMHSSWKVLIKSGVTLMKRE